jgi:hypothetical protein
MDEYYQTLSQILINNVPGPWVKMQIEAEVGDDWNRSKNLFWDKAEQRGSFAIDDYDDDERLGDTLTALREAMKTPGEKPWSHCTFTLHEDGSFKFNVQYDD